MLSEDAMEYIKGLLLSAYPNQKSDQVGTFWIVFKRKFDRYDEQDVADAVEDVIGTNAWFPSIAVIATSLQAILRRKRADESAQLPPLPAPRERINTSVVRECWKRMKERTWAPPITNRIQDLAERCFPEISESLIRKNYGVLAHYATNSRQIDKNGSYVRFRIDSKTGDIYEDVVYKPRKM